MRLGAISFWHPSANLNRLPAGSLVDFQITTDGLEAYKHSISDTLPDRVSFAQCIKVEKAVSES
jgi:hypothetical protein